MVSRKHTIFLAALLVASTLALGEIGCSSSGNYYPEDGYTHVSAAEAAEIIDSQDCMIVDVRSQPAYNVGHLPDAILIPHKSIADPATYDLLPDKDQTIIVYCDFGGLSKQAAKTLVDMGYTNVIEFDGLEVWDGPLE